MLKYPSYTLFTCCRAMQVEFDLVYNDNNDDFVPSFNTEVKESEVKENSCSFKSVQDAFAPPTQKGSIGSNGSKALTE